MSSLKPMNNMGNADAAPFCPFNPTTAYHKQAVELNKASHQVLVVPFSITSVPSTSVVFSLATAGPICTGIRSTTVELTAPVEVKVHVHQ